MDKFLLEKNLIDAAKASDVIEVDGVKFIKSDLAVSILSRYFYSMPICKLVAFWLKSRIRCWF